ncbi:MAG: tRNA lysidine(34) synthetase TilS [Sulfuriferula sp.]|nr:tRNA lysidine(34) synthetase TilS [Sulfuriferula sp.]
MDVTKKSPLNKLYADFHHAVIPHITADSRICVGLSGGVDSVVLLHLFAQLRLSHTFHLSAIHVHHGISQYADEWSLFCQQLCAQLAIPCTTTRVTLDNKLGVEAEARKQRYQQYQQQPADFIALAHHQDDQAETLMLQLLRGAGVKGLSGMAKYRQLPNQPAYLRPLLDMPRSAILAWAHAQQLQWIEDDSNSDTHYARNFLRLDLLPQLNQRYPAWRTALARSAANLAEASELLDELARMDAQQSIHEQRLDCHYLQRINPSRARNLLRYFFALHNLQMPSQVRLADMLAQLTRAPHDNHPAIPHGDYTLHRYLNQAYLIKRLPVSDPKQSWSWSDGDTLHIPFYGTFSTHISDATGIALAKFTHINIRLRQGGEMLRPDCKRPNRRLKDLLQQQQIPPWQRDRLPLVYSGDTLIHVPHIGTACAWQAHAGEPSIALDWQAEV